MYMGRRGWGRIFHVGGEVRRRWDLTCPPPLEPCALLTLSYGLYFLGVTEHCKKFSNIGFILDLMLINILLNINLTLVPHRPPHRHHVIAMS
jgi:hypothetical protein